MMMMGQRLSPRQRAPPSQLPLANPADLATLKRREMNKLFAPPQLARNDDNDDDEMTTVTISNIQCK